MSVLDVYIRGLKIFQFCMTRIEARYENLLMMVSSGFA